MQVELLKGAQVTEEGVLYRLWAPAAERVELEVLNSQGTVIRRVPFRQDWKGHFEALDIKGKQGNLYKFRLDGGASYPDPASRFQPQGVHGPSMVIDPDTFKWDDEEWQRPRFRDLIIYEMHVGAFSPAGTFRSAIEKLPHLCDLGINAIELMPLGDFAGEHNWGYDGVCLFAPAHAYGHPDDLRAFVAAAHKMDMAVLLDVVYNHFGPDGNYLSVYIGDYLDENAKTPWGGSIPYGRPEFKPVRDMVVANPAYWMSEFHIDGFRLDATHAIFDPSPRHILQELTACIHERGGYAIAEDPRNDERLLLPEFDGGFGFDAVWSDDFHHVVRVANTQAHESYYADFKGTSAELIDTLLHGWLYRGQYSAAANKLRGTQCRHLSPEKFVFCISNHDQTGNNAFGTRLSQIVSREAYLAASALLCVSPYTPMLFMGQEWGASSPFLFFTDHNEELGKLVTDGRREEFKDFAAFQDPAMRAEIPDPQKHETFAASRLCWDELRGKNEAGVLELYRACLQLRRTEQAFRPASRESWQVEELENGIGALRLNSEGAAWLIVFYLAVNQHSKLSGEICQPPEGTHWSIVLSTNEERFGGNGSIAVGLMTNSARFTTPELVIMKSQVS